LEQLFSVLVVDWSGGFGTNCSVIQVLFRCIYDTFVDIDIPAEVVSAAVVMVTGVTIATVVVGPTVLVTV